MITVGLITSEDIPEALKISLRELGSDYLSAEDFEEMIEPKDGFCMVARENGHVLGFSICKEFGPEEVDDRLRLPHSPEREMLLSKKKIGLLDSVSVSENARGLGVGRIMSEACLAQFERDGAEIMTAMAWEDVHGHANIDHILRNTLGITRSFALIGYWNQFVTSPKGHDCPMCGAPCKCYGRLYYRIF
mgnify:FL=1|jgi:GNAT superfamily N-acetyltransferase